MKPLFIIEHLEPRLWPWCIIEYKSISKLVGKNNVCFTNIKPRDANKLKKYGQVYNKSIKDIKLNFSKACVLDPDAPHTLEPKDAKFNYYIFGGILGDDPPKKRTSPELTHFLPQAHKRNLNRGQLSTDNAVYVVNEILKGKSLKKIKFKDTIEIKINKIESVILPYRYPIVKGKPRISPELVRYLKNKKGF